MKIAIMGASGTGKSQFIKRFLETWPMYEMPEKTFRNLVVENNLPINKDGNIEAQTIIRNALVDQAIEMPGKQFILHDRCILDNLAYTLYLASETPETTITPQFIRESSYLAQRTVKLYDIIFYFPYDPSLDDPSQNTNVDTVRTVREASSEYRQSIDNIFRLFVEHSIKRDGVLFDPNDCPPIIPLPGSTEEKLIQASLYVDETGNPYDTGVLLKDDINDVSPIIRP